MTKLTKAQVELLRHIEGGPRYVADHYRPKAKLIELGLATDQERGLVITPAGLSALQGEDTRG